MHWRRKWQPTAVFLPGESQGRTGKPGGLSTSQRVGHDWSDLAAAAVKYSCFDMYSKPSWKHPDFSHLVLFLTGCNSLSQRLVALKHVKYHVWNELPVQVQCTILDAWSWCTGTTQRDGMGREEGGGFRMGNTCIPVADSFWYLA